MRYAYFMVRVVQQPGDQAGVAGIIERLDTGEKRYFASSDELLDFVNEAATAARKIGSADEPDKA